MTRYPANTPPISPGPPAPAVPPIEGVFIPEKRSVWPTVIGILAIIFGSLGAANNGLCTPLGLAMSGMFGSMFQNMAQSAPGAGLEVSAAQMDALSRYVPANLAVCLTSAILSVVLLIGGVGLVRQRGWSGRTLNAWAVIRMIQAVPAALVAYLANQAMFRAMEEAAASGGGSSQMPVGMFAILQGAGLVGALFQLLLSWAFPLFILIWLSRRAIREEIAQWRQALPSPAQG